MLSVYSDYTHSKTGTNSGLYSVVYMNILKVTKEYKVQNRMTPTLALCTKILKRFIELFFLPILYALLLNQSHNSEK